MLLTCVFTIVLCHWMDTTSAGPIYARNRGTVFYQEVPVVQPPNAYRSYRSAYPAPISSPQRTMVFHGYYARPVIRQRQAVVPVPESAMTAFAAGETVAAGSSFLQPNAQIPECSHQQSTNCNGYAETHPDVAPIIINKELQTAELPAPSDIILPEVSEGQELENQIPVDPEVTTPIVPIVPPLVVPVEPEITTKISRRKNKANKTPPRIPVQPKRPDDDAETEDDDDDHEYNPFSVARGNFPVYNSFFPMVFGGTGGGFGVVPSARKRGNSNDEPTNLPRGATAIANSFSTGKGGVATSHATAYGGPQP